VVLRPAGPARHKVGHFGDVPQANLLACYGKTKPNTKSTHSPIKRNIQHEINTKTKARFSRLLQQPAWKRRGPILVSALHKFVTYLLTYLDTHLLTAPDPYGVCESKGFIHEVSEIFFPTPENF